MARLMAAKDWATTPLGPSSLWSHSLRTSVAIMLRSAFPMILTWGEQLVMLYNDAFIPTLGSKHPRALGGLLSDEFAEVWDEVGPMQRSVLAGGPSVWAEDLPLAIERGTGPEQANFTFSYSHVPDQVGPGGVLAVLSMTTDKVVAARRLAVLNDLASAGNQSPNPDVAVALVLSALGKASEDLQGGGLYRPADPETEGTTLVRSGVFGTVSEDLLAEVVTSPEHAVTLAWAGGTPVIERAQRVDESDTELHVFLPVRVQDDPGAVLVLCPHPLRPFDTDHERFATLVADQVGQILTVATERAREQSRLEALAALDAAKTAFLSNVSHEFRTRSLDLLGGGGQAAFPCVVEPLSRSRAGGCTPPRAPLRPARAAARPRRNAAIACGQRVRKTQPEGGASGDGGSPDSALRAARASAASPRAGRARRAASSARVYGWRGAAKSRSSARLDDPAEVHHEHVVGDQLDHRQVVRDEDVGDAGLLLQVHEQVEHLRLDRDVERRNRLVGDTTRGSSIRARAIAMRWRWPPENMCG